MADSTVEATPDTVLRLVGAHKVIPLRHRMLRADLPLNSALFDGDMDATTHHFAMFLVRNGASIGDPICCGSFMFNELDGTPAWQLRGMATDTLYQGRGVGARFLAESERWLVERIDTRLFWCNARVPAVSFYEHSGWQCISQVFEIDTAGPHRKMKKVAKAIDNKV